MTNANLAYQQVVLFKWESPTRAYRLLRSLYEPNSCQVSGAVDHCKNLTTTKAKQPNPVAWSYLSAIVSQTLAQGGGDRC